MKKYSFWGLLVFSAVLGYWGLQGRDATFAGYIALMWCGWFMMT